MGDVYEQFELDPENDIPVHNDDIDVEWLRQSSLFLKYGRASAEAEKRVKIAEQNIKVVRSELVMEANEKLDKPTGQNVEAYYRTHPKHQAAKQELIDAEYERDLLQSAKSAIYMKKSALENLVKLTALGWFSAPVAPKSFEELARKMEEYETTSANKKIRESTKPMRRRT